MPISFQSNWTLPTGGFHATQTMGPGRISDGPTAPTGAATALFTVHPGDDVGGWGGERAEVYGLQDAHGTAITEGAASGTVYFGMEFLFPAGWAATDLDGDPNSWSLITQLHGPDAYGASPALSLHAGQQKAGGPQLLSLDICAGLVGPNSDPTRHQFKSNRALIVPGAWNRLIWKVQFAADDTGRRCRSGATIR